MPADDALLTRLKKAADTLSRNQRALARHVVENYQAVAFATTSQLARDAGVSEATIVRFAKALGFGGYPALQQEIRRLVRADLRGAERFKLGVERKPAARTTLDLVMDKERENIAAAYESHDARAFARAVRLLAEASEIVVAGTRSTAPLAYHLAFALNKIARPARRMSTITSETYDELSRLDRRACVVAIGFPRYLHELVVLLDFVKSRKLRTLVVTDSAFSPLRGDVNLYLPAESASFVAFHCAPLIVLNALVHELSVADPPRTVRALNEFEAVAEARRYFQRA